MLEIEQQILSQITTNKGQDLLAMTYERPVLLIFLRHFGCVFCQQALKDIHKLKSDFEQKGVQLCFVHMASVKEGNDYFEKYGMSDVPHISDSTCTYYSQFGLIKGKFNQLFGLQVWMKTIEASVKEKNNLFAKSIGDGFQMPGVFCIVDGKVVNQFIHSRASDRPDYNQLIK